MKKWGAVVGAVFLLAVGGAAFSNPTAIPETTEAQVDAGDSMITESEIASKDSEEQLPRQMSELEVHFIDVEQGDSILLKCDGEAMLIDAGDNSKGTTVQLYLKKNHVEKLKYVIGTHPDADHIGGLDVILYKYDCETIIMPEVSNDTNTYRDVMDTLEYRNYKITSPTVGAKYELGSASFTVIGPSQIYAEDNDCSVGIKLVHGDNSFLFTGDAEGQEEQDFLTSGIDLEATVLKIGHHGSRASSSEEFLNKVNPQFAVISCGKGNTYGHPHAETLERLRNRGISVFRTDEQGSIVATSDGKNLLWNYSPSDTWLPGELQEEIPQESIPKEDIPKDVIPQEPILQAPTSQTEDVPIETTYILNTNTKKFHYPHCKSVSEMKEKNKKASTQTREEIISQGYEPCKRCKP